MIDWLQREAVYLWYYLDIQIRQIAPYWALGILLGSAVSVFGKRYIHGALSRIGRRGLGWLGAIPASLLGIASPLCMYGTIPLAASFAEQGLGEDYIAAFMMSSILLNPQLIFYSAALGREALLIRCISCFVCGCLAGWLIRLFYSGKGKSFFDFNGFREGASRDTDPNPVMRLLKNVWRNVKATGSMFALGILLTALYQIHVPGEFVSRLFGRNEGFGVLMAATIGVPVYMCGGGTIPLLLEWLADGMSLGSAAAFMITGPATKITNLGAMKIVLGWKRFLLYLAFVMLFSLTTGIIVDLL